MVTMEQLLRTAIEMNASDFHLVAGVVPKVRLNGNMEDLDYPVLTSADTDKMIPEIMDRDQIDEYNKTGNVTFMFAIGHLGRFRVNVYRSNGSIACSMRIIRENMLDQKILGLPDRLIECSQKRSGLILICGLSSSGRTTTAVSILERMNNTENKHIVVIADLLEYVMEQKRAMVSYREAGTDTASVEAAVRASFMEDTDVLYIDRCDSQDKIRAALDAAEHGQLVLASVTARDCIGAMRRILYAFPDSEQKQIAYRLSEALTLVTAQQLLPAKDGKSQVSAFEVLSVSEQIRQAIQNDEWNSIYDLMADKEGAGMMTMDDAILSLYIKDMIEKSIALDLATDPIYIEGKIKLTE